MKKLIKLLTLAAFAAGITWIMRDQLLPGPTAPTSDPPPFRNPPPRPATVAPRASSAPSGATDDLTKVNGIGPVYAKRLADAGVKTFGQLAAANADQLAARADLPRERLADWIGKAADLG